MRVLIMGVAGFIGSNLCQFLLKKGFVVYGVDDLSSGNKSVISRLQKNRNFKFYKSDLCHKFKQFDKDIDVIIHLAAKKIPRYENSLNTLIVNTKITENVLDLAREKRATLIFASTSDVYGINSTLPFKEDSNLVLGPSNVARWAYAVSKIYDEHLCFAYSDKYKFPIVILRFFGVYGPSVNLTWWGGPFGPFVSSIIDGKVVEIHGDGKQIRCFTFIDDLVEGIYLSVISPKAKGQIINLASHEKTSIFNLVKKIENISGKKAKIKFVAYSSFYGGRYQDVMVKVPDITKAKELIGFEAKTNLDTGIKKTIDWYIHR